MGDVVPLFRDRRGKQEDAPQPLPEVESTFTKNTLHEHMRTLHGWGGPRSTTRGDLDRIHEDRHRDPVPWWQPHRHV